MELTDRSTLDTILAFQMPPNRNVAEAARDYQAPAAKRGFRRCTCKKCSACLDEARWERIFQEKFADPMYYSKRMRRDSTLNF